MQRRTLNRLIITRHFLAKATMLDQMEPEVSARKHIHEHVQVLPVLEGHACVDYELVFEALEQLQLVHD